MKFFILSLFLSLGLISCYDAMDVGLNAAYLQSSSSDDASTQVSPDTSDTQVAPLPDTVYLKDGSIIHGMIIEENPGISLKIKTKSGNVFTYQITDIAKITHALPPDENSTTDDGNNAN